MRSAKDNDQGAGHNGTFNSGSPEWVKGQYGSTLSFDGNNKVEIPDHDDLYSF